MHNTVHNEMAKKAYEIVKGITDDNEKKEFRSLSRSFPTMIQVNGLCCAIAFLYSKKGQKKAEQQKEEKGNAYERLYKGIEDWLRENNDMLENGKDLMDKILYLKTKESRLYTNEIMNHCLWLKRFAEGMLSGTI